MNGYDKLREADRLYNSQHYLQAIELYKEAAKMGYHQAYNIIGDFYYGGEGGQIDYLEAAKWYRKGAELGDALAQHNLGNAFYEYSHDYEAVKWYRMAAEQGLAASQDVMGLLYESGDIVPQDERMAISWYRKAADQNYIPSMIHLACMYYYGRGVPRDREEGIWLCQQAVKYSKNNGYDKEKALHYLKMWKAW